jgi:signal transduction histidine kinase/DNA-binding NarL/FixJ family response regulator
MYIIKFFNDAYQSYLNGIENNFFIEIFIDKCINYISSNIKYYFLSQTPHPKSYPLTFSNEIVGYFNICSDKKLTLNEETNYKLFLTYLGILLYNSKQYPIKIYSIINYNLFTEIINSINNNIIITTNDYKICFHNIISLKILQFISNTTKLSFNNISLINLLPELESYLISNDLLRNKKIKIRHNNDSYFYLYINSIEYTGLIYYIFIIEYISEAVEIIPKNIISIISHELRNPLQTIILSATILNQNILKITNIDPNIQKYLKMIISSSNLMKNIINDILDFDKIINKQLILNISKINIYYLLKEIIDNFNENSSLKNISIELTFNPSTVKYIYSDSIKIKQILTNLIMNAIKYSKKIIHNNIVININSDDLNIYFNIADTGIGIKSENIPNLFNLYSQTADSKSDSNGIGLFLSKQLALFLGGDIIIKSSYGVGSTFIFEHPIKLGSPTIPNISNQLIKKINKILIVDDNQLNSSLLKTIIITLIDSNIEITNNGSSAFDLIKINNYDLIFMDINMEHMDGYSTTKLIRNYINNSLPATPNVSNVSTPLNNISFSLNFEQLSYSSIKIIALTGDISINNPDNIYRKYFDAILLKPIDSNDLLELFRKL